MVPTLQSQVPVGIDQSSGDDVVISGMSGAYPQSKNTKELSHILYNKINPVTDTDSRWNYYHPELPQHVGKAPGLMLFDAQFFKVHYRLSNNMDAMSRKLLEHTYQAIFDAGLSPEHLSGKKVGVYIGSCFSETEKACFYVASIRTGLGIAGCSKAMFANRISYWLNLKGPSMSIDAACASSLIALERAYEAITRGDCEAAIVGGSNICLHPQSSVHCGRIMKLSMDGKTKSFDKNADGCARGDAINVLFLQKAKNANRVYAKVCHVKSAFGPLSNELGQLYGPYRNPKVVTNFIETFYDDAGVDPSAVEYVEAFGAAIPAADKCELEAFSNVFCKKRETPLFVGSVMSNIGYTEAASGISAITKVLLGYQKGEIAANLHFQTPRDDIDALRDGRMQIVSEHQKFNRTYTAVNSVSVTGLNMHVLLHGNYKPKDVSRYSSDIPHLVLLSGRQESAVESVIKDLKSRPIDAEELALLHNIHEKNTTGHLGRGYTVLGCNEKNETVSLVEKVDYCDDAKKPLWFVYSGMGSQWTGMGTQLMRIPIFATAIERCQKALQPKGIDIIKIITSPDKTTFDNILHSFVGIAAVQIGLTDVLRELGMVPDNIIGHSVGELGCAYADGCLTAEEMILSAYSRGLVSVQTTFIPGSMAAVGIGYQDIISKCPPEIEVACHNGPESCTISGPCEPMREFVAELTAQGIFAREVPCSNIAYHSRYIKEAGPGLLKYLKEVIKTPRPRSQKWLSTSVAQDKWDQPLAQLSSAEYHTNNLLNPVLFEETARLIPEHAVLVEVAPHGLLQAILTRSLPSSCVNIPLTRRGHADNALFVLEAVGKMYMQGYNPIVKVLYPKIQFPVSSETPSLSHHVEWVHNELWTLPLHVAASRKSAAVAQFIVSMYDDEHSYLKGNVRGNETLYPFSGLLVAVWDTMAMIQGESRRGLSVQFHNVQLHEQPKLAWDKLLKFGVQLHKGNGYFEVVEENVILVSGYIYADATNQSEVYNTTFQHNTDGVKLDSQAVYKMFYDRECYYKGEFRSIKSTNEEMTSAEIAMTTNWVTLLDSMFQLHALRRSHDGVSQPRLIRRLLINMTQHVLAQAGAENKGCMQLEINDLQLVSRVGGILMEDVKFNDVTLSTQQLVDLKAQKFSPFFQFNTVKAPEALNVFLQITAENRNKEVVNILELLTSKHSLKHELASLIETVPGARFIFNQVNIEDLPSCRQQAMQADLVVTRNISISENICEMLYGALAPDTFVLSTETSGTSSVPQTLCRPVASATTELGRLVLSRWRPATDHSASAAVSVDSVRDLAMLRSTRQSLRQDHKLIVLTRFPAPDGLKDLVQQWRKEPERNKIHVVMINHKNAKDQNLDQLPNFDLAFNVLDNGIWGGQFYTLTEQYKASQRNVTLRSGELGNLDTLHWEEAPEPKPNEIAVEVHYAGLNIRDAKRATGAAVFKHEYEEGLGYGMDYSGVTESGERVMGVIPGGTASSRVAAHPAMMWPVPAHWTMEDAATVPLPYAQAYYILGLKWELRRGDSLLVHGATGALGLALISVALALECKVFATVSDIKKKRFLRSIYPQIPDNHIGNSRDGSFGDMINHHTKGSGCTVVVLCADNNLKHVAISCVGASGIAIDTNQIPDKQEFYFGMNHLVQERNYSRVDFSSLFKEDISYQLELIQRLISDGIAKGVVRPLSRVSYHATEAGRALRLLAASRHRGRALLRLQDGVIPAMPKIAVTTGKTHVVFAKSDNVVLAANLISRLADRGVSRVVLSLQQCSENVSDNYVAMKIMKWKKQGITVKLSTKTLSDVDQVRSVMREGVTLGPVEGVYVVATGSKDHAVQAKLAGLVDQLDVVTRKLCSGIRYFIVIAEENSIGQDVCIRRGLDQLPSTAVSLPKLHKFDDTASTETGEGLSCSAAVEAVERAVRAATPVLAVLPQTPSRRSFVQQLKHIAGISITEKTPASMSLEQLGLELGKADEVRNLIVNAFALNISKEELLKATVSMIREFEKIKEQRSTEITGLSAVFNYVGSDELLANHDMVFLPTLTNSGQVRDDEFLVDETYLVMVPGLEGHHERFRTLCERLKLPAVVMQPGLDFPHETVQDMAQRMVQVMLQKLKPKKSFYLLGYSFGVLVALEMAKALENLGLTGVVFCVDASPDAFPVSLEGWLREAAATDAGRLQDCIAHHMYQLMTGASSDKLNESLQRAYIWKDKVEACVVSLRGRVAHSSQYTRALIDGAYFRIVQARKYSSKSLRAAPLQSQLVLLRSRHQITATNDLGLASYSTQVPIVYELDSDHARALDNLRCSNIVNRHLDTSIWEAFGKRNLCDTYLTNANTFMSDSKSDVVV